MKSKDLKILRKKLTKANKIDNDCLENISKDALILDVVPTTAMTATAATTRLRVSYAPSTDVTEDQFQQCLQLFRQNMAKLYEGSSWGLDMKEKERELRHDRARYLLLLVDDHDHDRQGERNKKVAAFVHFRFEYDDEEGPTCPVLYVYEIQIDGSYRRHGLGRKLMDLAEQIAHRQDMAKVVLTVFKSNGDAMAFYDKLGYTVDDTSPSKVGETAADYEILSRSI
jgi:ribosomal protein S18 acetylase RimI-like enzyme